MPRASEITLAALTLDEPDAVLNASGVPLLVDVLRSLVDASVVLFVPVAAKASAVAACHAAAPDVTADTIAALEKRVLAWRGNGGDGVDREVLTMAGHGHGLGLDLVLV